MPVKYIVPSLWIAAFIEMVDWDTKEECLAQIVELEEDHFLAGFRQQVQMAHEKVWHDCHIKQYTFKSGDWYCCMIVSS